MAIIWDGYAIASHPNERTGWMNSASATIVRGIVDQDGRLAEAEPRLLALQRSAGGEKGGVLVIPQLASLARLARTLGVEVSRSVIAAEGSHDLELWVRAQLLGELVHISVGGWTSRPVSQPDPRLSSERNLSFAKLENDGNWECDAEFHLLAVDDNLLSLADVPPVSLIGQPVTRLFRLVEDEAGDLPLLAALTGRTAFVGQHAELRGSVNVQLDLHGTPVINPDGRFCGFRCGYTLKNRSMLAQTADAPPIASDTSDSFAKRLDLALRVPLTRIISNADEIGQKVDGPLRYDYAGYASDISSAGRHLLGLIDDLADVSAVEAENFSVEVELIDLADIARRAAVLLRVRAADKQVRIDAPSLEENHPAFGDFRRALQIMVNLLSNAVRYAPAGSNIWVRTERESDLAAIIVADQGKGIASANLGRIFDKFERVDQTEPGGNGLGLYISRTLAQAMKGDITVDSALGMGARFTLTLPAPLPA